MIELAPNVLYAEDRLIEALDLDREWLRKNVPNEGGMYRGDDLLSAMKPFGGSVIAPVVYFVRCCDAIKIGFATVMRERLANLQLANPHELTLLATLPGTMADERALHKRFAHLRIRGEWFRADEELLSFIKEKCGDVTR